MNTPKGRSSTYIAAGLIIFLASRPGLIFDQIPQAAFWPVTLVVAVLLVMGLYETSRAYGGNTDPQR